MALITRPEKRRPRVLCWSIAALTGLFVLVYHVAISTGSKFNDICKVGGIDCGTGGVDSHEEDLLLPSVYNFKDSERCPIYSYFEPTPENPLEMEKLWTLGREWRKNWYRWGWQPYIIGEKEAKRHPDYETLKEKFKTLPTVNDKFYELQCYLRWVAMAALGGGYMVDYDIMNYGFAPPNGTQSNGRTCGKGPLMTYTHFMPMLVAGDSQAYLSMAETFANYKVQSDDLAGGKPHVSDMVLTLNRFQDKFVVQPKLDTVIHYSHWYVLDTLGGDRDMPRWKVVNKLMCFESVIKKTISGVSLPAWEEGTTLVRDVVEQLTSCSSLREVTNEPEKLVPYTVVLLPANPLVAYVLEYDLFRQGKPSARVTRWLGEGAKEAADTTTFEQFMMKVCKHMSSSQVAMEGDYQLIRPVLEGLGIDHQLMTDTEKLYSAVKVLSGDNVSVLFLDKAMETLELLEYEIGFDLDEEERVRLSKVMTEFWDSASEKLLVLTKSQKNLLLGRAAMDAKLLDNMRRHFEARRRRFEVFKGSPMSPPLTKLS